MSDDKRDKSDITRIEDLSEYLHEEDDDQEGFGGDFSNESPTDSFEEGFADAKTDPDIQLPDEFQSSENEQEYDFASMEDDEFSSSDFSDDEFSTDDQNDSDEEDFPTFPEDNDDQFEMAEEDISFDDVETEGFEGEDGSFEPHINEDDSFDEHTEDTEHAPVVEQIETIEEVAEKELPEPIAEPVEAKEKTPIYRPEPTETKAPETFRELQQFAKNISYGNLASEGNPPFSIILKDIKYKEDARDIVTLLREFQVLKDEAEEKSAIDSLERGSMLISRLGEYSAITICHKLRRFDVNILMGLTEEINPPKQYESDDSGLVSKYSVYNSKSSHYNLEQSEINPSNILTSTTAHLEGYEILEYLGIASESALIESALLAQSGELEDELISRLPDFQQEKQYEDQIERENEFASQSHHPSYFPDEDVIVQEKNRTTLKDINRDLLNKLKTQAHEQKGNALVGVSFHVAPMGNTVTESVKAKYQVICSASVVWANKI